MANALIHHFGPTPTPYYDDEGDPMMDYYFQMIDDNDMPISELIGPYRTKHAVEQAARRAQHSRSY